MTKLKEVGRSATVAWSPFARDPLLAAGTAAGAMDMTFSSSMSLEIFSLNLGEKGLDMPAIGHVTVNDRFSRLAWGNVGGERGLLVGGMTDGSINVWDANEIVKTTDGSGTGNPTRFDKHKGPVKDLDFNSHQQNLLASGGVDGEIFIYDLGAEKKVYTPGQSQNPGEISAVAWNCKVPHILASAGANGGSTVWDLKLKRPVITFCDTNNRPKLSAIGWNPDIATQVIVASEDDKFPVLQVWDLRNALSPIKDLHGHSKGVLGLSWCPFDSGMLLTCGKDNRTLCWNPSAGEVLCELPASMNWNFDVRWHPSIPAILSTASFDGKVSVYSLQDAGSSSIPGQPTVSLTQPPKWLKRPAGVSFGFGGQLVSFLNTPPQTPKIVNVQQVVSEPEFVTRSDRFESAVQQGSVEEFCEEKITTTTNEVERESWSFMKVLFDQDSRRKLLKLLGFNEEDISIEIQNYLEESKAGRQPVGPPVEDEPEEVTAPLPAPTPAEPQAQPVQENLPQPVIPSAEEVSELFGGLDTQDDQYAQFPQVGGQPQEHQNQEQAQADGSEQPQEHAQGHEEEPAKEDLIPILDQPLEDKHPSATEEVIKRAILTGNTEAAVHACINFGRMADAFVLAATASPELFAKVQDIFFKQTKRPYAKLVRGIVKHDLSSLVETCRLSQWKETAAVFTTYSTIEEFSELCDKLASRLENEAKDVQAATICYLCSGNFDKAVDSWVNTSPSNNLEALQDLIEKITIFRYATESASENESMGSKFGQYAELLADQGRLVTAMQYLRGFSDQCLGTFGMGLRDRIYHSARLYTEQPPAFPFEAVAVNVAPAHAYHHPQHDQVADSFGNAFDTQQQSGYTDPSVAASFAGFDAAPAEYAQPAAAFGQAQPQPDQQHYQQPDLSAAYASSIPYGTPQQQQVPQPSYSQAQTSYQQPSYTQQQVATPAPAPAPAPAPGPGAAYPQPQYGQTVAQQQQQYSAANGGYSTAGAAPSYTQPSYTQPSYTQQPQANAGAYGAVNATTSSTPVQPSVPAVQPTPAVATPTPSVHVPAPTPKPAPKPAAPTVNPQDAQRIIGSFSNLLQHCSPPTMTTMQKRKMDDVGKRLQQLFDKLTASDVSAHVVSNLLTICTALESGDFKTAHDIHVSLTTSDWDENGNWLVGMKRLIDAAKS